MEDTQSQPLASPANLQFIASQLDNIYSWLSRSNTAVRAMLLSKDKSVQSQDHDDSFSMVSHFESLLFEFQSLLIWENPNNSATALFAFTLIFWSVVFISPAIIPTVSTLLFVYFFYEMWVRYVWPEIRVPQTETKENWTSVNPNVLSAPEIQNCLAKLKKLLLTLFHAIFDLRQRSHGTFCILSLSFFGIIYILGRVIPGAILVFFCFMLLLLTPGLLLHVLPPHMLEALLDYCKDLDKSMDTIDNSQINESSKLNDLVIRNKSNESIADRETSTSPSPFKNQFFEHFFPNEPTESPGSSISDISDDFEIISEIDLGEMNNK